MTDETRAPRDDLYRAMGGGVTSEDGKTLTVRLAPHDEWATIHSQVEGHFLERFARSAYRKTMAEQLPKILFQHGKDPEIGEKVIASTDEVGEDSISPYARGKILDGLPELVRSGLRAGAYGASHRFNVVRETWDDSPKGGPHNPDRLPERTIVEARLFELGPVTWPAYPSASASLRSVTDEMRGVPTPTEPVAPSLDAAVEEPHLEPERRDEPVTIAAIEKKEPPKVDIKDYHTLDEMGARVRELDAEIKRAAELPGILPDAEQVAFDEKVDERSKLDYAMTAWRNRLTQVRTAPPEGQEAPITPVASISRKSETDIYDPSLMEPHRYRSAEQYGQTLRDNAMRAAEQAAYPHPGADQDGARSAIANLLDYGDSDNKEAAKLILQTGSPIYRRAFAKYIRSAQLTPEEQRAVGGVNALATGGYAVPFQIDPTLIGIGAHTTVNPFRAACRVVTLVGTNTWEPVTATAMTAAFAAENAAAVDTTPTFNRPTFQVQRAQAFSQVSIELLQDHSDLVGELSVLINEAKDTLEESKFAIGAGVGSDEPLGMFITGTFTNQDSVANDAIDVGDPELVEAALALRHRMNASWFMARKTIRAYQALETTGGKLFGGINYANVASPMTNSPTGNTGLRLLGYPIWEVPSAPTGVVDGTITAVFGDAQKYAIVDRLGLTVEVIPHLLTAAGNLPIGARGIYAYWRTMGGIIDVNGMISMSVQ